MSGHTAIEYQEIIDRLRMVPSEYRTAVAIMLSAGMITHALFALAEGIGATGAGVDDCDDSDDSDD